MGAGGVVDGVEERGGFSGEVVEFNDSLEVGVGGGGVDGGVGGEVGGVELVELVFPASSTAWLEAGESGEEPGLRRVEAAEDVVVMEMGSKWKMAECSCGGFH